MLYDVMFFNAVSFKLLIFICLYLCW